MSISNQPAFWIGLAASVVIGISQALSGPGIFVEGNPGLTIANVITVLAPVIAGIIIRYFVTPVSNPTLPAGTVVATQNSASTTTIAP